MISPSETRRASQIRVYDRAESVVFLKTTEEFGGLSNMAGGFPLVVNSLRILTSEALYQACRFPHLPEIQQVIIAQASPMTAKMKGKPYRRDSRPDWGQVRVKIMRWCLRVKLAQNWTKFSELLLATENRPIVEASRKDDFWGAKPVDDRALVGMNVLGRLLMELREEVKSGVCVPHTCVEPLAIPDFLLIGQPIQPVVARGESEYRGSVQRSERRVMTPEPSGMTVQIDMFDQPLSNSRPGRQGSNYLKAAKHPGRDQGRHSSLARLAELRLLKDGWFEGSGHAPPAAGLDWLSEKLARDYPDNLPLPYLYPTPEGGICLEWSLGPHDITLDIDFAKPLASLHALNRNSDEEQEGRVDINEPAEWARLIEQLQRKAGESI